jgi:hypothetical protein
VPVSPGGFQGSKSTIRMFNCDSQTNVCVGINSTSNRRNRGASHGDMFDFGYSRSYQHFIRIDCEGMKRWEKLHPPIWSIVTVLHSVFAGLYRIRHPYWATQCNRTRSCIQASGDGGIYSPFEKAKVWTNSILGQGIQENSLDYLFPSRNRNALNR